MSDGGDISPREERIRRLAYQLWEDAGKPFGAGDHERFWRLAELEIDGEEPGNERTIPRR